VYWLIAATITPATLQTLEMSVLGAQRSPAVRAFVKNRKSVHTVNALAAQF